MADPTALLADPEWYAHRFVESDDAFRFIRLPRADHSAVPFLTDDYLGQKAVGGDVPAKLCLEIDDSAPLHFLFHSAFCGSTALVRALDKRGIAMGLSEPMVFNDIVGFRWRGADPRGVARAADAACRLLSRRFAPGEAVIAKPSNIINPLAALLMALRPQARAVFLYAPLETFLISVANKGMHCRIWGRQLLEGYIRDGVVACLGFTPEDYFLQSDLQVAAIGWLAQQHLFQQLLARVGPQRLMSLDGDAMFTDPAGTIAAVGGHYGLKIDRQTAAQIAQGPAFSRHSKSGAAYSADTRAADYAQVRAAHGAEIDMVVTWAKAVAEAAELPLSQDRWATP